MTILEFDEIDRYQEFREWIVSMTPSQLMRKKREVTDVVWDLLTYLYMLGYNTATEEVGQQIAEDVKPFLPSDYDDSAKPTAITYEDLSDEQKRVADEAIYKKFDNKNFIDRVNEYAELGEASNIIRVVETDGNRVYNTGGMSGAKASGAKYKTWNTMEDFKVRDTHDFLAGITVPIEDKFVTYDGDEAMEPGGFENVQNNARCRCFLTFGK